MDWRLDRMERTLAAKLTEAGCTSGSEAALAHELLEALAIGDLIRTLETSEEIIRAADGFHPVARFFLPGTAEQRYILDVLSRPS